MKNHRKLGPSRGLQGCFYTANNPTKAIDFYIIQTQQYQHGRSENIYYIELLLFHYRITHWQNQIAFRTEQTKHQTSLVQPLIHHKLILSIKTTYYDENLPNF